MKTIYLIIFTVVSQIVFGQWEPTINYRKMTSDVWRIDTTGEVVMLLPKWDIGFKGTTEYAKKHLNIKQVRKHLISSLKEFKKDYNRFGDVEEDKKLTIQCNNYAKLIPTNFVHDKKIKDCSEVLANISFLTLTMIDECDGDFNKIVSDCIFDKFSISKVHTSILVDDTLPIYGFGLYVDSTDIWIVIRQKRLHYK